MDKRKNNLMLIVSVLATVLFGARIVVSFQQEKNRKEQIRLMQDLSKQQMNESSWHVNTDSAFHDILDIDLDQTIKSLDSIGEELQKSKVRFDSLNNLGANAEKPIE